MYERSIDGGCMMDGRVEKNSKVNAGIGRN